VLHPVEVEEQSDHLVQLSVVVAAFRQLHEYPSEQMTSRQVLQLDPLVVVMPLYVVTPQTLLSEVVGLPQPLFSKMLVLTWMVRLLNFPCHRQLEEKVLFWQMLVSLASHLAAKKIGLQTRSWHQGEQVRLSQGR